MTRPTPRPALVRTPARRPVHRRARPVKRKRIRLANPYLLVPVLCVAFAAMFLLSALLARHFAKLANTSRHTFDAILVLGTPADSDGNPTPQMLDRVTEAVREYDRGIAPRLILSGSAAHNRYTEADVMAHIAEAQGVPRSVILEETQALDTIQNACYSTRILKNHGWGSAEVVTSPFHVPRAAMIFSHLPIEWRVHTAPDNLTPGYYSRSANLVEIIKTARYLAWSRWTESCPS